MFHRFYTQCSLGTRRCQEAPPGRVAQQGERRLVALAMNHAEPRRKASARHRAMSLSAARCPLVATPRSAASARPGFVSRSFTASLIRQALAHAHGCGPEHYDRLAHLSRACIGVLKDRFALKRRVDAFHQPQVFARANGRVGSTSGTPLITKPNTTLHQVRQSVNGSFLASKDGLILESTRAPRHHDLRCFVRSYVQMSGPGGLLFASRGGLNLDSASEMRASVGNHVSADRCLSRWA